MENNGKGGAHIKAIEKTSVHRICSGQVILDLATGVKELVENSLDAGATCIEIKLKDYGAESFEVADNGCGVSPENFQALTLKYHTSKISDFSDLQYLTSFGFRGEALSSLCALGDLTIVTRTKNEPLATQLQYDHSGSIISQKSEARPVGTTVCVSKLFKSLPVRYREFNKNIRREYSRLVAILHAYAMMAKGVRLVCTHITGKTRTMILKTQGTSSIKDNIITVFGTKVANCLEPVSVSLPNDSHIEGFISKPGSGSGRASGDRQFYYINNRPVELPKVAKLLNDLYRSFNSLQYPIAVLNFTFPTTSYDVNVTPDKRKVFLHAENELLVALRESLERVYAPDKYTYSVQKVQCTPLEKEDPIANTFPEFETQQCLENNSSQLYPEEITPSHTEDHGDSVCINGADNHDDSKVCDDLKNQSQRNINEDKDASPNEASIDISTTGTDLDLFQCKTPIVSSGTDRRHKFGTDLAKRGHFSHSHLKVSQSKLTGFLTDCKRPRENDCLVSEMPLLKNCYPLSSKTNVDMHPIRCHGSIAQSAGFVTSTSRLEGESFTSEEPVLKKRCPSSLTSETSKEINIAECCSSAAKNLFSESFSLVPSGGDAGENLYISNKDTIMDDNKDVEAQAPVVTKRGGSFTSEEPVLKKHCQSYLTSETNKAINMAERCSSAAKNLSFESFLSVPPGNDAGEMLYMGNKDNIMDDNKDVEISAQAPVVTKRGGSLTSEEPVLKRHCRSSLMFETNKEINMAECRSSAAKNLSSDSFLSVPSGNDDGEKLYAGNEDNIMDDNNDVETSAQAPVVTKGAASTKLSFDSLPASEADDVGLIQRSFDVDVEGQAVVTSVGEMTSNSPSCTIEFNSEKLRKKFAKDFLSQRNCSNTGRHVRPKIGFHAASMGLESTAASESAKEAALAAATRELEITFNKADFRNMKVLGQFNLGFILAKLHNDVFIIDQHASDEKYNFERLSKTTILNRQPLLRPLPLDLSVAEEVIVMTHLEVFRKNGFDFIQHTDGPPGHRLCLTAVPFSQKTTFGAHDVQELVALLMEEPSFGNISPQVEECFDEKQEVNLSTLKNFIRPSRIRAMLASRACRSSIMIGDALSKKEMEKILAHLAELDSPWNCPHGRPTMRHLVDMTNIKKK